MSGGFTTLRGWGWKGPHARRTRTLQAPQRAVSSRAQRAKASESQPAQRSEQDRLARRRARSAASPGSDSGPDQEGSDVAAADASPDGDGGTVGTEQPDSDGTIGGVVAGVRFVGLLAVIDGTGYLLRRGFRVG